MSIKKYYCCSNFLTEAPGQYTGPGIAGAGGGLVTRGGGPGVIVQQQGHRGTSKYPSTLLM